MEFQENTIKLMVKFSVKLKIKIPINFNEKKFNFYYHF